MKPAQQYLRVFYTPKKVMLNVWWEMNGIICWDILSSGCGITADLYRQQLDRVAEKLKEEQDRIFYLLNKARPHIAKSCVKNYWRSDELPFLIHLLLLTWLQQTTICSIRFLTTFVRKSSSMRTTWKLISSTSLVKSPRISTNVRSCLCKSVGDASWIVMVHI